MSCLIKIVTIICLCCGCNNYLAQDKVVTAYLSRKLDTDSSIESDQPNGTKQDDEKINKLLNDAKLSLESGDYDKAKMLYSKASKLGSSDAHFALAYNFVLSKQESIFHFKQAAERGHSKALDFALEEMLFRGNSLVRVDPVGALELYYKAKKSNPQIKLFDERNVLRVIKMCSEPEGFDPQEFMKRYNVKDEDGISPFYDIWELAEEASRYGRFGEPNPELILNLIIRGGSVPAEFKSAVEEAYDNWKRNIIVEFRICDHVTSEWGISYCLENNKWPATRVTTACNRTPPPRFPR